MSKFLNKFKILMEDIDHAQSIESDWLGNTEQYKNIVKKSFLQSIIYRQTGKQIKQNQISEQLKKQLEQIVRKDLLDSLITANPIRIIFKENYNSLLNPLYIVISLDGNIVKFIKDQVLFNQRYQLKNKDEIKKDIRDIQTQNSIKYLTERVKNVKV